MRYTTRPGKDTQQGVAQHFGVTLLQLIAAQMGHPGKDALGKALPIVPRKGGARFCESCWNSGVTIDLPAHARIPRRGAVGYTGGAQDWAGNGGVPDFTHPCHTNDGIGATALEPCCAGYVEDPITGKCSLPPSGVCSTEGGMAPCCGGFTPDSNAVCHAVPVCHYDDGIATSTDGLPCCPRYTADADGKCHLIPAQPNYICSGEGVYATSDAPCCSGYDLDTATGRCALPGGSTGGTCHVVGESYSADADCCDGLVHAPDGTCRVPEVACLANGVGSASAQLCCSGYTDASGLCAAKPAAASSNTALLVGAAVVGIGSLALWLALRK